MSQKKKNPPEPVWFICESCEGWYCTIHDEHAGECLCPPIEEWPFDPRTGDPIEPPEHGLAL